MCGVVALFTGTRGIADTDRRGVESASLRMIARGPDDVGMWEGDGALLAHRRLAILDLDARAAQPMHSACGRYVIVFNGEIYNFKTLRRELEDSGVAFATTSDTEVVLSLFAAIGEAMLPRLHGMFALVIWDRMAKKAFVARDPYGIKPLYVGTGPHGILVASQVKALLATGLVSREPDARGQAGFWMLGSVPEPHTWYRDIRAVPAGHCAWVENGNVVSVRSWRDIGDAWRSPASATIEPRELQARVRLALKETVERHMVADVPVGVFLSGGIDSGALAGLMVEAGARDLEGITIAYDEFAGGHEDEAPVAGSIARHYGIRHHIRRVTRQEFLVDLPRILHAMDQPTIDGINTWYASKATAERGLKVVVSGVGGDELFLGYDSFRQLPQLVSQWRALARVPGMMSLASSVSRFQARRSGNRRWNHAPNWARTISGAWWLRRSLFAPEDLPELMGDELAAEALVDFTADRWVGAMTGPLGDDATLALAQIESQTFLRNQLLRDSDWASMDHSLELRTPLVDAHLLEQLQGLLPHISRRRKKILLADAPTKSLPPFILNRKKTGFGIPTDRWLSGRRSEAVWTGARSWAREVSAAYCAIK